MISKMMMTKFIKNFLKDDDDKMFQKILKDDDDKIYQNCQSDDILFVVQVCFSVQPTTVTVQKKNVKFKESYFLLYI